jgi:8-oxo-dGTP pyrophosphatase MutT (NUDIX family)
MFSYNKNFLTYGCNNDFIDTTEHCKLNEYKKLNECSRSQLSKSVISIKQSPRKYNFSINTCNVNPFNNTVKRGAAGACIYSIIDNKIHVLLGLEYNGEWNFAMGKREPDETLIETATRELNEEMHINISPRDLLTYPSCADTQMMDNELYHILLIYFVELPFFIPSKAFSEKVKNVIDSDSKYLTMLDYKWIPLEDILDTTNKWLTLKDNTTIKLRRCSRSILRLANKKNIFKHILSQK